MLAAKLPPPVLAAKNLHKFYGVQSIMATQRTVEVLYRCHAGHQRIIEFGEKPPSDLLTPTTMPQFREPYQLLTTAYFSDAKEYIEAQCFLCHNIVPLKRVSPQPE
jgi:hypothetical protein